MSELILVRWEDGALWLTGWGWFLVFLFFLELSSMGWRRK